MQKGSKGHFQCDYVLPVMFLSSKSPGSSISIPSGSGAANQPITIRVRVVRLMKVRVSSCSSVAANMKPPVVALTFAEGMTEQDANKQKMVCLLGSIVKASGPCTQSVFQHLGSSSMRDGRSNGSQYGPMVNA